MSVGIKMTGNIDRFLDHPLVLRPRRLPESAVGVVGWGLKRKSLEAVDYARRVGLPYLALEDGFLRSVGLGNTTPPLSLIVDDVGVYFDASRPSKLEALITAAHSPAERQCGAARTFRTGSRQCGWPGDLRGDGHGEEHVDGATGCCLSTRTSV